jgi:hypothetical protein
MYIRIMYLLELFSTETGSEDDGLMDLSEDDFFLSGSSSDEADADDEWTDKSTRYLLHLRGMLISRISVLILRANAISSMDLRSKNGICIPYLISLVAFKNKIRIEMEAHIRVCISFYTDD